MRILQVNKYSHVVGGTDRYFMQIIKLLKNNNNQVTVLSTIKENSAKIPKNYYMIDQASYDDFCYKQIKNLLNIFFNLQAYNKIKIIISKCPVDIAHLHSVYHHLSPSIIFALLKNRIPIVQTIEDYHLISPNYNLFHGNCICEITKPTKFYKAFFHKCVKSSYLFSFIEMIEKYFHYLLGWERDWIDIFIAPSQFTKTKLIEYGIAPDKIIQLSHYVEVDKYKPDYSPGNYILYFGRLSPEKGLLGLIRVMEYLPHVKLKIVGCGDQEKELKKIAAKNNMANIEFLGFQENPMLMKLILQSRFCILPSIWYEVFGLSILESFACGKPVIASDIGGIPEIITHGYNGLLFTPGNANDCREKILKLWNNPSLCGKLGRNARRDVEKKYNPHDHYRNLMKIYQMAINKHK